MANATLNISSRVARFARDQQDAKIAKLYAKGYTYQQIAEILSIHESRISVALSRIRKNYAKVNAQTFQRHVLDQLRSLDVIKQEAWEAWERSIKPQETTSATVETNDAMQDTGDAGDGVRPVFTKRSTSQRKKTSAGDPRFLEIVLQCEDKRARLLGLEQPSKLLIINHESAPERATVTESDERTKQVLKILTEIGAARALQASSEPDVIDVEPQ